MVLRAFLIFGLTLNALAHDAAFEEASYQRYLRSIENPAAKLDLPFTAFEQKLLVDALWDAQEDHALAINDKLDDLQGLALPLDQELRVAVLRFRAGEALTLDTLSHALMSAIPTDRELSVLVVSLRLDLQAMGLHHLVTLAEKHFPEPTGWVSASERPVGDQTQIAFDLWDYASPLTGAYSGGIKIYMFCRSNRLHPCMFALRDRDDRPVLNERGELWLQPSLGSSAHGLPSYQRNGNTPAGVLTIDGVMPAADQQISFGKFRRLILNFLPKSNSERATRTLLPQSSIDSDWWRPATVARDVGRNLLRIHGTGKRNNNPTSSWFPFMRTSGCIAQRENSYNGIDYRDQRDLLDVLMAAQGLEVNFENEARLKGMLFIIELNDEARAVTREDLAKAGIQ